VGSDRLSVAAVGQISLAWPSGRAGRATPIASGDLLLSVAGQPPEGPPVPAGDKPETSPFASWVLVLMDSNSSQVRLVAVSRGGGPLKTAVFSFAESERRACRRANVLWLAKNMQLLRGGFEFAVGMTGNGSGRRDMLHIQDPNPPLEILMENYYAEEFPWPRELIREALSLVPAGHGDYMLALNMQGRGVYVQAPSLLRRHLREHPPMQTPTACWPCA
jgi:hypothetical protein